MLGSLAMRSRASSAESAEPSTPSLRNDGLRVSMSDAGSPLERHRTSSRLSGSLANSRAVNSIPFSESDAFALRQDVQVAFQ